MRSILFAALGAALLCGPASAASRFVQDPYPSTYHALASGPVLIQHATVLTGTGQRLDDADVLLRDGKVAAVGRGLEAPADVRRIDGTGKWVTPASSTCTRIWACIPAPASARIAMATR